MRKKEASIWPFHMDFLSTAPPHPVITLDMSADELPLWDSRGETRLYPEDVGPQGTRGKCRDPTSISFSLFKQTVAEPCFRLVVGYKNK